MAITDLRYAATLLKSGFSAAEVRDIIGLSVAQPQQAGPEPEQETEPGQETEPEQETEQETEPEQETENAPDPEPEQERKQDPRTRRENPKTETLTETLAKLL